MHFCIFEVGKNQGGGILSIISIVIFCPPHNVYTPNIPDFPSPARLMSEYAAPLACFIILD